MLDQANRAEQVGDLDKTVEFLRRYLVHKPGQSAGATAIPYGKITESWVPSDILARASAATEPIT